MLWNFIKYFADVNGRDAFRYLQTIKKENVELFYINNDNFFMQTKGGTSM